MISNSKLLPWAALALAVVASVLVIDRVLSAMSYPDEHDFEDWGLHGRIYCEHLCEGAGSFAGRDDMEPVEIRMSSSGWQSEPSEYECVCGPNGD